MQEAFSLWVLRSGVLWNKHVDLSFVSVYIPARHINHYNMPFCVMCFVKDSRNFCGQMFSLQERISVCYRKYLFTWLTPWPDYCCIFSWSKFQPFNAPVLYHTTELTSSRLEFCWRHWLPSLLSLKDESARTAWPTRLFRTSVYFHSQRSKSFIFFV